MNEALEILKRARARRPRPAPPRGDDLGQAISAFIAEHPILDVFKDRDLKRTGRQEHHGPCPQCGGVDRFCVWPARGRAWCRQCKAEGDALKWAMRLDGHDPGGRGETARYLTAKGYLRPPESTRARKPGGPPTGDTSQSNLGHSKRLTRADVVVALGRQPSEAETEFLQERAAIMLMDGGLPLHKAEREALRCLIRHIKNGGFDNA